MTALVRVYNNGERVVRNVSDEDAPKIIRQDTFWRFGCALFQDGRCIHRGYLSPERCAAIEAELATTPTAALPQENDR